MCEFFVNAGPIQYARRSRAVRRHGVQTGFGLGNMAWDNLADTPESKRRTTNSLSLSLGWAGHALACPRNGNNDFDIELTLNEGREEAYAHGTGYGHVSVVAPDVASTRATSVGKGHKPAQVKEVKRGDELLARCSFIRDPDGYRIGMLERHGHYR